MPADWLWDARTVEQITASNSWPQQWLQGTKSELGRGGTEQTLMGATCFGDSTPTTTEDCLKYGCLPVESHHNSGLDMHQRLPPSKEIGA